MSSETYPNQLVKKCTLVFHLWSLSKNLVALAFLNRRIPTKSKESTVKNLKPSQLPDFRKYLQINERILLI